MIANPRSMAPRAVEARAGDLVVTHKSGDSLFGLVNFCVCLGGVFV